jgi:Fe-S-cluster-containing hydrogenase component 2
MLKPIIECTENIPCNPCESSCKFGAISVGEPITNFPCLDESKCKGCGLCAVNCPGLAIVLIDWDFGEEEALVAFPYEYLPMPEKGQIVQAVDRCGQVLGKGVVYQLLKLRKDDPTMLIVLRVPKAYAEHVRSIKRGSIYGQ